MIAGWERAVERRNHVFNDALDQMPSTPDRPVAAIDLAALDVDRRNEDHRLLREALASGAPPSALGSLFVAVVADLAYEVDWKDHFRFWPILGQSLESGTLELKDARDRRLVADAFDAFSTHHQGVISGGAFAGQFPLMSRPLVHAVLPRCAQRHIARLFERATARGVIPADVDERWPVDEIVEVGESLGLPLFVRGLMENRAVLERAGRVLLGAPAGKGAPGWVQRVARNVERDAMTRDLVAEARAGLRRRSSSRRARRDLVPTVKLVLDVVTPASLWLRIEALEEAAATLPEVVSLARQGALLRARASGQSVDLGPLFNALASPVFGRIAWKAEPLSVGLNAQPYEAQTIPDGVRELFERGHREIRAPLVLRLESESRYVEHIGALTPGDSVAVVLSAADALSREFEAGGYSRLMIGDSPAVVALVGVADRADAATLSKAKIAIEEPRPALHPALVPPIRREGNRLFYPVDREIWLRLTGASDVSDLRAELTVTSVTTSAEMGLGEGGEIFVRVCEGSVPAGVAAELRVYGNRRARSIAGVTLSTEEPDREAAALPRWRAAIHPIGASVEHLSARQCWLDVETLPGLTLEVELEVDGARTRATIDNDARTPLATARQLRDMFERTTVGGERAVREVVVRVRSTDEPNAFVEIARLGPSDDPLRFLVDKLSPRVESADDDAQLWRLAFQRDGMSRVMTTPEELRAPGVYLASSGDALCALCVGEKSRHLPRLSLVESAPRGLDSAEGLIAVLRAVDVAPLWPPAALTSALFLRRAAVRALEDYLVGALCGARWLYVEGDFRDAACDPGDLARAIAPLLWLDEVWLTQQLEEGGARDDPFELLTALLTRAEMEQDERLARDLLLMFYQRGMVSRRNDAAAIKWAWADARRARLVRACFLMAPDAVEALMRDGSGDDEGA